MAIDWAFRYLKAKTLFAIYPEGRIAVRLLAAALGFHEDKEAQKNFQFPGQNQPIMFQRLDSNLI